MDRIRHVPVKEAKLTDYYLSALGVAKTSPDALRLREWSEDGTKDFTELLREFLANRLVSSSSHDSTTTPSFTIRDANAMLDDMMVNDQARASNLMSLSQKLTVNQMIWFTRLVLEELKLGISDSQILKAIHPKAPDVYNANPDLEGLCRRLAEGIDEGSMVSLFSPIGPMLASRLEMHSLRTALQTNGSQRWRCEAKIDGERIQLHTDGSSFAYFSRSGADYSHLYGHRANLGPLSKHLQPLAMTKGSEVQSIILDGEMVGFDESSGTWILFGDKHASIYSSVNKANTHPCCKSFITTFFVMLLRCRL